MPDFSAWLMARGAFVRFLLLAIMGAVAALGHAPTNLWFLTIAALAALFTCYPAASTPRQAFAMLWAFGFGYFALSLRWIVEPFLVDVATHGWMAPFALMLMGAGAALFWGLAGGLAARVAHRNTMMLALLLVAAEMLRSWVLTGFPWALLGHVWIGTGLAQLAAFAGPHVLSFMAVTSGLALAALTGRGRIVGLVYLGLLVAVGFVLQPRSPMATEGPMVRLVQPNAPQSQKWDPAFRDMFLQRMIRMTGAGDVPDLVVWPETAVPYLLSQVEDDLSLMSGAARGAPMVFGIQRRDADFRAFNSLVVLSRGAQIESIYDKRHLVPFGEYIPGTALLGRMGATGLAANLGTGFTVGEVAGPLDIPGIGAAVPLICYEGIFAEEIQYGDTRPRLLLLITNDAWFGRAAGPRQHLAQARLRAIEQGLPMVRVANTGISAMIDGHGRVTAALPMNVDGALDAVLPPALEPTLYARFGEWPMVVFLFFMILGQAIVARRDSD